MSKFLLKPTMAVQGEERVARLSMDGVMIGEDYIDREKGTFIPGVSAALFRQALDGCRGSSRIEISLTSPGGSVPDALDMVDAIKNSAVPVTITGHVLVASAATLLMCAAQHSALAPSCTFMVHHPYSEAAGTPAEIAAYNEHFMRMFDTVFSVYAEKCGKDAEAIKADVRDGKWMSAQQALEYGLVDEVLSADEDEDAEPGDDEEEKPSMETMKSVMGVIYHAGAKMGIPIFKQRMAARETEALKAQLAEMQTQMAAMRAQLAQNEEKMASFAEQVKQAAIAELAKMSVAPETLPAGDAEPAKQVMLTGSMEDMLRASH